jgi:hypothetical protein
MFYTSNLSVDQIIHQNVTRSRVRGRGVTSRRTLIHTNRSALFDLASSGSAVPLASANQALSSLEAFESLVAAGNFAAIPPVDHLLDTFTPYLQDEDGAEASTSTSFFGRIQQTIIKTMDEAKKQEDAAKTAKKKRKETHSVTVCAFL